MAVNTVIILRFSGNISIIAQYYFSEKCIGYLFMLPNISYEEIENSHFQRENVKSIFRLTLIFMNLLISSKMAVLTELPYRVC